jgi:hypothetical protein
LSRKFPRKVKFSSAAAGFPSANLLPGTDLYLGNARNAASRFSLKKRQEKERFCNAWILIAVIQNL